MRKASDADNQSPDLLYTKISGMMESQRTILFMAMAHYQTSGSLETENLSYIQSQRFVNPLRSRGIEKFCMETFDLPLAIRCKGKQWSFPALSCRSVKHQVSVACCFSWQ